MRNPLKIGLTLLVLALLCVYFLYAPLFTFEKLKDSAQHLSLFVQKHYLLSVLLYLCVYILSSTFALPFSVLLTLTAGFLFGVWYGTLYAVLGATTGATLCFLMVRYVFRESVIKRYKKQLVPMQKELAARGVYYLLSVRFFALIPFALINVVAGLLPVSLGAFVITTLIGIIPAASIFAYAGQSLATLESPKDIFSARVLGACIVLGLLALVPVFYQKYRQGAQQR